MGTKEPNKLKGGEFLVKDAVADHIFIPEEFDEDQQMMASSATEFIDKEVVPNRERFEKKDYALVEELMKKAGEMGFLGITTPEKYEGMDMGFNTSMLLTDKLSGATGSFWSTHRNWNTSNFALWKRGAKS